MIRVVSWKTLLYACYYIEQDIVNQARKRLAEMDQKLLELKRDLYKITPVEDK